MSAREDYPAIASLLDAWEGSRGQLAGKRPPEAIRAFLEVQKLRLELAWTEDISRCRGEENELLREKFLDGVSATEYLAPASWFWCTTHQTATSGGVKGPPTCTLVGPFATPEEALAFGGK